MQRSLQMNNNIFIFLHALVNVTVPNTVSSKPDPCVLDCTVLSSQSEQHEQYEVPAFDFVY